MGTFIAKQPNGLYCRFSTVVDCPTDWNMTEEEYIELRAEQAREDARRTLEYHVKPFEWVKEYFHPYNMSEEEFKEFLKEVSEDVDGVRRIRIGEFIFVMTCEACPEQYDVYHEDDLENTVAYVRLRHGYLRVDCPDCGGETVFDAELDDESDGCFSNEEERMLYLGLIRYRIKRWLKNRDSEKEDEE